MDIHHLSQHVCIMNEFFAITLLVWNVHGLPFTCWTGGSDPVAVAEEVAQVDHTLFFGQEAWNPFMVSELIGATRPNDWKRTQWRAGLFIASDFLKTQYNEYEFAYTTLSKWDWLAKKGFQTFVGPRNTLFINTHLDSGGDLMSQAARVSQVTHIVRVAREHHGPIVIAGDLNLRRSSKKRKVDRALLDWMLNELKMTIAIKRKLDYILVSKEITVVEKATLVSGHSDHRPLLVTLEIN